MQPSAKPRWIFSLSMLVMAGSFVSSTAVASTARCQLQSIELREPGAFSEWVAIVTDKPANFTSFKLSRPARIVVDFPETTASPRKAEGPTGGPISNWSVEMLGAGEQIVARLTIELREDADYTLTNTSGTLALRFVPATARPLTALEHDPVSVAPAVEPKTELQRDDAAERLTAEKLEQARLAKEKAEQDRLTAEKEKTDKARAVAEAKERARLDAEAAKAQAEKDRREKEAQARREAQERAAAEKARRAAEAKARQDQIKAEREAAKAKAAADREARRALASTRSAVLERVAFHRSAVGAELTLKLSEPVVHATREEGGRLILDLEHTKITLPNNRRPLDTRFFGTAVSRITPREDRNNGRVSIEMELGTPAPYEVKADGKTIAVVFQSLPASEAKGPAGFSAVP